MDRLRCPWFAFFTLVLYAFLACGVIWSGLCLEALVSIPQNLNTHSGLAQDLVRGVDIVGNQKFSLILFLQYHLVF